MWPEGQPASHRLDRAGTPVLTKDGSLQVREPFGGEPQLLTNLHPSLDTGRALSQMTAGTLTVGLVGQRSRSNPRPALPRPNMGLVARSVVVPSTFPPARDGVRR